MKAIIIILIMIVVMFLEALLLALIGGGTLESCLLGFIDAFLVFYLIDKIEINKD